MLSDKITHIDVRKQTYLIIIDQDNSHMKHVSIVGGGANINIDTIKECIQIAKLRSMNV